MVTAIIPAYNEEETVGEVIASLKKSSLIGEIIVVDDGSSDGTARIAKNSGVKVIMLPKNCGKGVALAHGVENSKFKNLFFADADVTGFTAEKLDQIIRPVDSGECVMYVGILARKVIILNKYLHYFPILGGTRALTKTLWLSVPAKHKNDFKTEIALNYYSHKFAGGPKFGLVPGLTHHIKEKKYGLLLGLIYRLSMIFDILAISLELYIFQKLKEEIYSTKGLSSQRKAR
ncbi:glycosyltransferase [Candidatus Giovannonibacteria bacterium]|nr:glycosyltransferase [Candidatus Giovannonibacteria bacterium]